MDMEKWILTDNNSLINLKNVESIVIDEDGDLVAEDVSGNLLVVYSNNEIEKVIGVLTKIAIWLKSDSAVFEV